MRNYLIGLAFVVAFFVVVAVVAGSSSAKADEMPCQNCLVNGVSTAHVSNSDAGGLLADGGCYGWCYPDGGPTNLVMPLTVVSSAGAKLSMQCPKTAAFPTGQIVYYEPGSATTPPDGGQVHAVLDFTTNADPFGIALRSSNDRFTIGAPDGGGYDCNVFSESP
jgi:hypothetical protein